MIDQAKFNIAPDVVGHFFCGDQYLKAMNLPAGHTALTHKHNTDHASILATGRVRLHVEQPDGSMRADEYVAPAVINVKAGCHHMVEALENVFWICAHVIPPELRDSPNLTAEMMDEVTIEKG